MSGLSGPVGSGWPEKVETSVFLRILKVFSNSIILPKVFHTFLEGTESPRAGSCSPRPSKKYEKPKENDDCQWKSIKFLRKTKLLNMSVGGQSPAQIHERIFLLKTIDKKTPRRSEPATGVQPRFEKVNCSQGI